MVDKIHSGVTITGIYTFATTVVRVAPLQRADAGEVILKLKGMPVLKSETPQSASD